MTRLSVAQQKILAVLADGFPHDRAEMLACLDGQFCTTSILRARISELRTHLRARGQDILVEFIRGKLHYRHVRLLTQ